MYDELMQTVDWSRAQFALTAMYHWLFVPLTLGLGFLCAIMETLYYRTGDEFWKRTTKFWMRLFGVNFAIGVATGLILEFEFGTNWSNYSYFVGDIFGAPLAIEGIMAFFMESTFIAVMFFGWDKVSKRFHLAATWLTAIGASLSALWILVANAWMQYPVGMTFNPLSARNEMTSFRDVLFSPVAINKFFHTVTSAYVLSAVFVIGVSAWFLLKNREYEMARKSIGIASVWGLVFAILTATTGDRSAAVIAQVQPMKLAAMEALYDGEQGADLTVIGILRPGKETSGKDAFYFKIGIPKLLSVMSFRDADSYVAGINDLIDGNPRHGMLSAQEKIERGRTAIAALADFRKAKKAQDTAAENEILQKFDPQTPQGKEFLEEYFAYFGYGYLNSPEELIPNVPILFYSFRIMVGWGVFLIIMLTAVWRLNRKDRLRDKKWLLYTLIAAIPITYIASQAGWVVAELGRQPWTIQNLLPTSVSVSDIASESVMVTFFIFLALFTCLLIAEIGIMTKQIKIGPDKQ